jgi:hypothetical protein
MAARRTDGVNVRASHERRSEILRAAQPTDGRAFTTSVWDFYDSKWRSERSAGDRLLVDEGVDRVVLLVRGKLDPRAFA